MTRRLLPVIALLLAACTPATPFLSPRFQVEPQAAAVTYAPGKGGLTVRFEQALPKAARRRLLATLADVNSVVIRLVGAGADVSYTVPKAAIAAGVASHTFTDLTPGSYSVTIRVLDLNNTTIGSDARTATVTAGGTATVAAAVALVPAPLPPRALPAPTTAGGGGPATGEAAVTVTLTDGTPLIVPPIVNRFVGDDHVEGTTGYESMARDAAGGLWFTASQKLYRVAGGAVTRLAFPGQAIDVAAKPDGSRIYVSELAALQPGALYKPDGSIDAMQPGLNVTIAGVAANGDVVSANASFARPGAPGATSPFPAAADMLLFQRFTAGGSLLGMNNAGLVRYAPDGSLAWSKDFGGNLFHFDVAPDDVTWVLRLVEKLLVAYAPDGALLGEYVVPASAEVHVGPDGDIWVYGGTAGHVAIRYAPNGRVRAHYQLVPQVKRILVTSDGHLWAAVPGQGVVDFALPALP